MLVFLLATSCHSQTISRSGNDILLVASNGGDVIFELGGNSTTVSTILQQTAELSATVQQNAGSLNASVCFGGGG
jgi:hypothetical protein